MGQPLDRAVVAATSGQLQADAQKADSDLTLGAEGARSGAHKLQADGAIADKDVAQAEADFRKAKSDRGAHHGAAEVAGHLAPAIPPSTSSLRAQVPGVVVERNVLVGQEVRADQATPLLTITNLDDGVGAGRRLRAGSVGWSSRTRRVTIRVPAYPAESFPGKIGQHRRHGRPRLAHGEDSLRRWRTRSQRLKPEMFAKVERAEQAAATRSSWCPSKAVLNDGEKSNVIVAQEGNTFRSAASRSAPRSTAGCASCRRA